MIKTTENLAEYSIEYINQLENNLLNGDYLANYHLESLKQYYKTQAKICAKFEELRLISRLIRLINLRLIKNKTANLILRGL